LLDLEKTIVKRLDRANDPNYAETEKMPKLQFNFTHYEIETK
jgi:hypothetical protein